MIENLLILLGINTGLNGGTIVNKRIFTVIAAIIMAGCLSACAANTAL